jgi:hypothetical protein
VDINGNLLIGGTSDASFFVALTYRDAAVQNLPSDAVKIVLDLHIVMIYNNVIERK